MYYDLGKTNSKLLKASRSPIDINAQASFCISDLWREPTEAGLCLSLILTGFGCLTFGLLQWSNHCAKAPRNLTKVFRVHCTPGPGLQVPIQGVVQHLPVHWVWEKAKLEWQQLWGSLRGQSGWNQLAKVQGWPSPTDWAGRLFSINLLSYNCLSCQWTLHPWYLALVMMLLICIC